MRCLRLFTLFRVSVHQVSGDRIEFLKYAVPLFIKKVTLRVRFHDFIAQMHDMTACLRVIIEAAAANRGDYRRADASLFIDAVGAHLAVKHIRLQLAEHRAARTAARRDDLIAGNTHLTENLQ